MIKTKKEVLIKHCNYFLAEMKQKYFSLNLNHIMNVCKIFKILLKRKLKYMKQTKNR